MNIRNFLARLHMACWLSLFAVTAAGQKGSPLGITLNLSGFVQSLFPGGNKGQ